MKALRKHFWAALVCAAVLPVLAQPVQITDARGAKVQLPQSPQRIVSLLPSLTESLCALGACDRLVGVDSYSNWPAQIKALPVVGGGLDPNIERIVSLKPDLVLISTASMASRTTARLESLGLKVVALEPRNYKEAHVTLQKLGAILNLPPQNADRVWAGIDADMAKAAASVPEKMRGQRVYFEASRGPYAAGETSFIGETLTQLHLRNVIEAKLGPFPRINPEYVVKLNPDILMAGERSWKAGAPDYPGWAQMRAVKQGAMCSFTPEQSDILVRPGPRMAQGAHIIAACLRKLAGAPAQKP